MVEKRNQVSAPAENNRDYQGTSRNIRDDLPYVYNDITTFFTMMVGIYFPSVTGETAEAHFSSSLHDFSGKS